MSNAWQVQRQKASCSSEVSVFDTSTGKCEQNVRELISFLSHTRRCLLCAFVSQVGILLTALMTWSILQCASFMSGQGEKGVRTHKRIQKHHICFWPLLRYSHEAWELLNRCPAPKWKKLVLIAPLLCNGTDSLLSLPTCFYHVEITLAFGQLLSLLTKSASFQGTALQGTLTTR